MLLSADFFFVLFCFFGMADTQIFFLGMADIPYIFGGKHLMLGPAYVALFCSSNRYLESLFSLSHIFSSIL